VSSHGLVSVWLGARTPVPPPQLVARIAAMTADIASQEASTDAFLAVAESAMSGLLRGGCLTRDSALDLLAVDALVTYAFEMAADDPNDLEDSAARALARISALPEPSQA
jgi:hypothetical protein